MAAGRRGWGVFFAPSFGYSSPCPHLPSLSFCRLSLCKELEPQQQGGVVKGSTLQGSHVFSRPCERKACNILAPQHPQLSVDQRQYPLHGDAEMSC